MLAVAAVTLMDDTRIDIVTGPTLASWLSQDTRHTRVIHLKEEPLNNSNQCFLMPILRIWHTEKQIKQKQRDMVSYAQLPSSAINRHDEYWRNCKSQSLCMVPHASLGMVPHASLLSWQDAMSVSQIGSQCMKGLPQLSHSISYQFPEDVFNIIAAL